MKNALQIIEIVLKLLPTLLVLIKEFEVPGAGQDKKAAVLGVLGALLAQIKCVSVEVQTSVLNTIDKIIDAAVSAYNLLKVFKHKDEDGQ